MTFLQFTLILISVSMAAFSQPLLKLGMSHNSILEPLAGGQNISVALAIVKSPLVVGGLALYVLSAVFWLFVLAKMELSVAYPFVGLGFIVTMVLGLFVLGEAVTLMRVCGTLLIATGCAFVVQST